MHRKCIAFILAALFILRAAPLTAMAGDVQPTADSPAPETSSESAQPSDEPEDAAPSETPAAVSAEEPFTPIGASILEQFLTARANPATEGDWTIDKDTGELTAYGGSATTVTIPATVDGTAVTSLGQTLFTASSAKTTITSVDMVNLASLTALPTDLFYGCTALTSVDMSALTGVTSLPERFFEDCDALTTVNLPPNLESIGRAAFFGCEVLTNITLPAGLKSIGQSAFDGDTTHGFCKNLKQITIPDNVTSIGSFAFSYSGLKNIDISNVTSLGNGAFYGCSSLESVTLSDQLQTIKEGTFSYCTKLETITLPASLKIIEDNGGAFYHSGLKTITIPDGVTSIGSMAFCDTPLTSATIPNTVTHIGSNAFSNTKLTEVRIPKNVVITEDDYYIFHNCKKLTKVTFDCPIEYMVGMFAGCSALTEFTIPQSVKDISWAFSGCTNLSKVTIPGSSLTEIGDDAFHGTALASITLPSGVTSIGNFAFAGTPLTEITIPSGVTYIGCHAFESCTGITGLTFPAGLTDLGTGVVDGCSNLESITFLGDAPYNIHAYEINHENHEFEDEILAYPDTLHANYVTKYIKGATGFVDEKDPDSGLWLGWPTQAIDPPAEPTPTPTPTPDPTPTPGSDEPTAAPLPDGTELIVDPVTEETDPAMVEAVVNRSLRILGGLSNPFRDSYYIYVYQVDLRNKVTGEIYTKENFPAGGIDVTIPLPYGEFFPDFDYYIFHFHDAEGNNYEVFRNPPYNRHGFIVHVDSLSPFVFVQPKSEAAASAAPSESAADGGTSGTASGTSASPQTGDTAPIAPFIVLAAAGGTLAGFTVVYRRKRRVLK